MSSQSQSKKTDRFSFRIDTSLLVWVRWYASQHGVTVTHLITEYFRELREESPAKPIGDVDQL